MKQPSNQKLRLILSMDSFKQWTRSELEANRGNFDFDWVKQFPLQGLQMAWLWELERELGSGNQSFHAAWQAKHGDAKPCDEYESASEFLPFREVLKKYPDANEWNYLIGEFPRTIHAIRIDLDRSKEDIVRDFSSLVEDLKKVKGKWCQKKKKGDRKNAGIKDYIAWFRDLSIYRLAKAGYRSKEQMRLLPASTLGQLPKNLANWNHKRGATEKRIHQRLHDLQRYAQIVSEDGNMNGSPEWSAHFFRL